MAASAEAVARLSLDAKGFDNQARSSFREFSKQLTTVKDGTDAAMRGAEALQKVFIKSLFGTAVIGAANILADVIRDVGNNLFTAGQAAQQALDKFNSLGEAGSLEESAAQAQILSNAISSVKAELTNIESTKLKSFIGQITGATE